MNTVQREGATSGLPGPGAGTQAAARRGERLNPRPEAPPDLRPESRPESPPFQAWLQVLGLLAAATLLGLLSEHAVSLASLAMIYVLAVALAAYRLDWVHSAGCALGAAAALNFFFVPPRFTFEVESRDHLIALATMLLVAFAISRLGSASRAQAAAARRHAARARQLQDLAGSLAAARLVQDVARLGREALAAAFAGPVDLALTDAHGVLEDDARRPAGVGDGMRRCMKEAAVLGPGTGRWPGLNDWYLPLRGAAALHGAARVAPARPADHEGLEHAVALLLLVGQAIDRLQLDAAVQAAALRARHEAMRATFLAAVSHDLRTPLAAILGAASSLLAQRLRMDGAQQDALLAAIVSEAQYLATVADNTLQLVRLSNDTVLPDLSWESPEEIVGSALARVRPLDPQRRLQVSVDAGLPLLRADAVLLGQLLVNLLDNALRHTAGPVEVQARLQDGQLNLCVQDRGPGMPAQDPGEAAAPDAQRPVGRPAHGLGLRVCRAIAQAHGGRLVITAREGGGSSVCARLPVAPQPGPAEAAP